MEKGIKKKKEQREAKKKAGEEEARIAAEEAERRAAEEAERRAAEEAERQRIAREKAERRERRAKIARNKIEKNTINRPINPWKYKNLSYYEKKKTNYTREQKREFQRKRINAVRSIQTIFNSNIVTLNDLINIIITNVQGLNQIFIPKGAAGAGGTVSSLESSRQEMMNVVKDIPDLIDFIQKIEKNKNNSPSLTRNLVIKIKEYIYQLKEILRSVNLNTNFNAREKNSLNRNIREVIQNCNNIISLIDTTIIRSLNNSSTKFREAAFRPFLRREVQEIRGLPTTLRNPHSTFSGMGTHGEFANLLTQIATTQGPNNVNKYNMLLSTIKRCIFSRYSDNICSGHECKLTNISQLVNKLFFSGRRQLTDNEKTYIFNALNHFSVISALKRMYLLIHYIRDNNLKIKKFTYYLNSSNPNFIETHLNHSRAIDFTTNDNLYSSILRVFYSHNFNIEVENDEGNIIIIDTQSDLFQTNNKESRNIRFFTDIFNVDNRVNNLNRHYIFSDNRPTPQNEMAPNIINLTHNYIEQTDEFTQNIDKIPIHLDIFSKIYYSEEQNEARKRIKNTFLDALLENQRKLNIKNTLLIDRITENLDNRLLDDYDFEDNITNTKIPESLYIKELTLEEIEQKQREKNRKIANYRTKQSTNFNSLNITNLRNLERYFTTLSNNNNMIEHKTSINHTLDRIRGIIYAKRGNAKKEKKERGNAITRKLQEAQEAKKAQSQAKKAQAQSRVRVAAEEVAVGAIESAEEVAVGAIEAEKPTMIEFKKNELIKHISSMNEYRHKNKKNITKAVVKTMNYIKEENPGLIKEETVTKLGGKTAKIEEINIKTFMEYFNGEYSNSEGNENN